MFHPIPTKRIIIVVTVPLKYNQWNFDVAVQLYNSHTNIDISGPSYNYNSQQIGIPFTLFSDPGPPCCYLLGLISAILGSDNNYIDTANNYIGGGGGK